MDDRFYLLLAIAYDGLERYDDVAYAAGQAIAVAPQEARAYILRARAYIKQNNYERAKMDIDKALQLNPSSNLAQNLKKEIDSRLVKKRNVAQKTKQEKSIPSGLIIYIGLILLGAFLFIYFRYEDLFHRKKVRIPAKKQQSKISMILSGRSGKAGWGRCTKRTTKPSNAR